MKKTVLAAGMVLIAAILGLSLLLPAKAENQNRSQEDSGVSARLQEIIRNQETILAKLDEIKSELEIVKIRATRK